MLDSSRITASEAKTINNTIKRALRMALLDAKRYSAHSLRSGMITAAAHNGASLASIMDRSGHTCVQTTMGYVRRCKLFDSDPLKGLL